VTEEKRTFKGIHSSFVFVSKRHKTNTIQAVSEKLARP
jgi:hypothetical protein